METIQERQAIAKEVRLAVRHSAVYGLGSILAKAIGFAMLPFYTHYLTPPDYGILEILDLSMSLFGMVFNMGAAAAFLRYYGAAQSDEEKHTVVSTGFLFAAGTALAALLLGLTIFRPVSALLVGPQVPPVYLLLSFVTLLVNCTANLPRTYLRALEASGAVVTLETSAVFLTCCLNVFFIVVLKIGLFGILTSSLIAGSLQAILLSVWVVRKVGITFRTSLLRQMLTFGAPLILSNLAAFALNFSDRFFLQHFRSLEVVGVYAVGYKFAFMLNYLVIQPFCAMWEPRRYVIYSDPDHPKIFGQIFVLYALLLVYGGLAVSAFSPEIVKLMVGPKFADSQNVIPIVTLAYVFWGIGYHVQLGMILRNRTKLIGTISAGTVVLNIGLNYFLISAYGMIGAAWATLLSFLATAAGCYWCSQQVLRLPLGIARVAGGVVVAVTIYAISQLVPVESPWMSLLIKSGLLCVFPMAVWKLRILSPGEKTTLLATARSALARAGWLPVAAGKGASA